MRVACLCAFRHVLPSKAWYGTLPPSDGRLSLSLASVPVDLERELPDQIARRLSARRERERDRDDRAAIAALGALFLVAYAALLTLVHVAGGSGVGEAAVAAAIVTVSAGVGGAVGVTVLFAAALVLKRILERPHRAVTKRLRGLAHADGRYNRKA